MPICFVIMPYGGSDERLQRHFSGVYQSIIVPAAVKAGYDVKRSDITGEPGNITQDIIRDLADADIVIADLTGANANVFFELGIRHVLRKSGTVHIIDENHQMPFDIRQYRAIEYTTELADLPAVIDQIVSSINKRASQPGRPDNPVHDALPGLPIDIRSIGDQALRDQILQMQETVATLQAEKESIQAKLSEIDPGGTLQDNINDIDVDEILTQADEIMKSTGEHVLLRLKASLEAGGNEAFVKELRKVLKSQYLSINDYLEIARICSRLGLLEHRRAALEVARRRYPFDGDILLNLADAYDDSANPTIQERGRLLIEEYLGIEHKDAGPEILAPKELENARRALLVLFNMYNRTRRYNWILSVTQSAENILGPGSLIIRNKAKALAKLGRSTEAEKEFKRAIELDPSDDTTHVFYSDFLDDEGRYEEAYQENEQAIYLDPEDGSRYSALAIQILNRGLVRDQTGNFIGPIVNRDRIRSAVPLLLRAVELGDQGLRQHIIGVLVRADALVEAQAIARGDIPHGSYDENPILYVESKLMSMESYSTKLNKL
jgi:uncharacterized protein (TIGR02996 family)